MFSYLLVFLTILRILRLILFRCNIDHYRKRKLCEIGGFRLLLCKSLHLELPFCNVYVFCLFFEWTFCALDVPFYSNLIYLLIYLNLPNVGQLYFPVVFHLLNEQFPGRSILFFLVCRKCDELELLNEHSRIKTV